MAELPQNWIEKSFEKLIKDVIGGDWGSEQPTSKNTERVAVIRGTDYKNWDTYRAKNSAIRYIKSSSLSKRNLSIGDIVLEVSGGGPTQPVARTIVIDKLAKESNNYNLICSNFFRKISIIDRICAFYVNYYCKYAYKQGDFNEYQTQTTNLRNLNFNDFINNVQVPLPPLNEQKRIVKKLDEIMPKVEDLNSRLEKIPMILKRARQSILNQAITGELTKEWRKEHQNCTSAAKLIKNIQESRKCQYELAYQKAKANGNKKPKAQFMPEWELLTCENDNWAKCYIANIFSVETGATPLKSNESYYKNGNIPWVKTGEVQNCEIFEAEEFITEKALHETNVKLFPKNTLLVAMYGEGKTRGQVGRLKFEATTNQACAALINTELEYIMNEYIYYYCLSQYNEIRRQASGGNQPNLNLDKIKMWEINIPPIEEQEEIVRQVKTLFEKLDKIEESYKKAKQYTGQITQSVLHKAFIGNLVPQNPNDKPVEIPD